MYYQAIKIALQSHKDQVRKLGKDPYVIHPLEVGYILSENGADQDTVIAGILHDVIEDTDITYDTLKSFFSDRIINLINSCTEPDKSLTWDERKKHTLNSPALQEKEIQLLMCADKLSNLRSIQHGLKEYGTEIWKHFNAGYSKQKWYYATMIDVLKELQGLDMYEELKEVYTVVFAEH